MKFALLSTAKGPTFYKLASDNFNRANETPLSGGGVWSAGGGLGAYNLVSNAAAPSNLSANCCSFYNAVSFPPGQYSRANLTTTGTAGGDQGGGLSVRSSGSLVGYTFQIDHAATLNATISKNSASDLISWTQPFTDGDQFTLAVQGTGVSATIYVFDKTFTLVQRFTDTAGGGQTTGSAGLFYSNVDTAATADNWEGGGFTW